MRLHQRPLTCLPLAILLSLSMAPGVQAQNDAATPAAAEQAGATAAETSPPPPAGSQSRQWLRAQASREQASPNRPTLSGPTMKAVHERYVRSFTTPIEPTSLHNRDAISSN